MKEMGKTAERFMETMEESKIKAMILRADLGKLLGDEGE